MVEKKICQYCKEEFQPSELSGHFIEKSKSDVDEESDSILLCKKCHAKVHRKEISKDELIEIKKLVYNISNKKRGLEIGIILLIFSFLLIPSINIIGFLTVWIFFLAYFLAGGYCGYCWPQTWQRWAKWIVFPIALAAIPITILSLIGAEMTPKSPARHIIILLSISIIFLLFLFTSIGAYVGAKTVFVPKPIIVIFILIAIILPTIGTYFVFLEKNTPNSVTLDEMFLNSPTEGVKLQELKIKNYFILPNTYKLPDVTACLYDIEENFLLGYPVTFMTENGGYIYQNSKFILPLSETKIFLQELGTGMTIEYKEYYPDELNQFDEILLLSNVGMNNYKYCNGATEEDIVASEKIIIK